MSNHLKTMYGIKQTEKVKEELTKNPNRVAAGLRAQGVDHLVMVNEDGSETQVPTQRYVQSLEEQLKKQRTATSVLERKLARCEQDIQALISSFKQR